MYFHLCLTFFLLAFQQNNHLANKVWWTNTSLVRIYIWSIDNINATCSSFHSNTYCQFLNLHEGFTIHTALIKCYQIILLWKLDFNGYLMVWFLSKKDLACTCSACSKWVRVYILAEILSKMLGEKTKENWGPYLRAWLDILTIWCQLIF